MIVLRVGEYAGPVAHRGARLCCGGDREFTFGADEG